MEPPEQRGELVSLGPRPGGTNRPGCLGMGCGQVSPWPGLRGKSGRWKQASLIWLELGLTHVSKPGCSHSPFPGPGRHCLLTQSAKRASSLLVEESETRPPAWPAVTALRPACSAPTGLPRGPWTFSYGKAGVGGGEEKGFPKMKGGEHLLYLYVHFLISPSW